MTPPPKTRMSHSHCPQPLPPKRRMSHSHCPQPLPPTPTVEESGAISINSLHQDIFETHILTRLDGLTLASASCASSKFHSLSYQHHLWSKICHSSWPSTASPRIQHIISTFPSGGPRSFFSFSSSLPIPSSATSSLSNPISPSELISAVDIHYQGKLVFTKVQDTETMSDRFRCAPFRIVLLDPKDAVPTEIFIPEGEISCTAILNDMTLSWILIDPIGREAVNLSSIKPVSVRRHWLSGEVQVLYSSIFAGDRKGELVQCEIVVACGGPEGGEMRVREVSLQVEDTDGIHLNGEVSLVIMKRAMEGKRGKGVKREEERRRWFREYMEMKEGRRIRKMRIEVALDMLYVAFGATLFAALWYLHFFVLCR